MFPKKYSKEQIIVKMEAYCAYQERCLLEVDTKLRALETSPNDINTIIEHLIDANFFDQKRYAQSFAIGKFRNNKWGKQKIKAGLYNKKVSSELISKALETIDPAEYKKMIADLFEKKWLSLKVEKNEFDRKQKTLRYLQSKGFELNEILGFL